MRLLQHLFEKNRVWAAGMRKDDPSFFERQARQQTPEYLWIGCADSRVPASVIVGLDPGAMFVHRNLANVVVHTDLNCLSVVQYAVELLQVRHVIVCGHYGCGGVLAAMQHAELGLIDNWLRHLRDVYRRHEDALRALPEADRPDRFCELNVIEQVAHLCQTTIVQSAWARGQDLTVHGWVYGLNDGLLHDLGVCVDGPRDLEAVYRIGTA